MSPPSPAPPKPVGETSDAALGETPYTLRAIREMPGMAGLSPATVSRLVEAGILLPRRGSRNEYRFGFQDVVLLRTAQQLRAAAVTPQRLLRALAKLREELPRELPLAGLRITAVGSQVAVRSGALHWQPESGQLLLDFEVSASGASLSLLARASERAAASPDTRASPASPAAASADADAWFAQGEQAEPHNRAAAEAAYRRALRLEPGHGGAALNLGALLGDRGCAAEALAVYDAALTQRADDALLHFNRAIALEDLGRDTDALAAYERCLQLAPQTADAHYNAARLHERLGDAQQALRHLSAYRRLSR